MAGTLWKIVRDEWDNRSFRKEVLGDNVVEDLIMQGMKGEEVKYELGARVLDKVQRDEHMNLQAVLTRDTSSLVSYYSSSRPKPKTITCHLSEVGEEVIKWKRQHRKRLRYTGISVAAGLLLLATSGVGISYCRKSRIIENFPDDHPLRFMISLDRDLLKFNSPLMAEYVSWIKEIRRKFIDTAYWQWGTSGKLSAMHSMLESEGFTLSGTKVEGAVFPLFGYLDRTFDCDLTALLIGPVANEDLSLDVKPGYLLAQALGDEAVIMAHTVLICDRGKFLFDPVSGEETSIGDYAKTIGVPVEVVRLYVPAKNEYNILSCHNTGSILSLMQKGHRESPLESIEQNLLLATELYKGEFADKGLKVFNQMVVFDPGFSFSYFQRGNMRLWRREFNEAVEDYKRCLELDNENVLAWNCISTCYDILGDMEKCDYAARRTLELCKSHPELNASAIRNLERKLSYPGN